MEGYPRFYGDGSTFEEITGEPPTFFPIGQWPARATSPVGPPFDGVLTSELEPPFNEHPFPPMTGTNGGGANGGTGTTGGGATGGTGTTGGGTRPINSIFPEDFPRKERNPSLFNDPDYFVVAPKRTRWFNNILQAREKNARLNNPNANSKPTPPSGGPNPPKNPNA